MLTGAGVICFLCRGRALSRKGRCLSLFRPEVFEQRRLRLHGAVILTGTAAGWMLVGLLGVTVGSAGIWLATGHYARTQLVIGRLVPDGAMTRIVPTRPGVVARLDVREGERVHLNQPLATIVIEQGSADRADPVAAGLGALDRQNELLDRQIALSREAQDDQAARLLASISQARTEIASLDRQIALQQRIVASAKDSFEPLTEAVQQGYFSRLQYEGRRQQYLAAQSQLAQLEAQRAQFAGQLRHAEVDRAALPRQTASRVADLLTSQASLVQKRVELEGSRSYVITAPVAGRVSALQVTQGSTVTGQTPLMSIVADGARLEAELYAPSRAIGFARVGQDVRLMYDAFPYQRFGSFAGRITAISHTVLAPNEVDAPIQGQVREPVYRVRVALGDQAITAFGQRVPLQPGMTLAANLVLDRRTFLDWLLEPINAVRNRS